MRCLQVILFGCTILVFSKSTQLAEIFKTETVFLSFVSYGGFQFTIQLDNPFTFVFLKKTTKASTIIETNGIGHREI